MDEVLKRLEGRVFTLDGDPVEVVAFLAMNEEEPVCTVEEIAALGVGESLALGGGAAADFTLRREA